MMKRFTVTFLALAAIILAIVPVGLVQAQTAYETTFLTSITYQNVGNANTTVRFDFYAQNSGTAITIERPLNANASGSLFVGNVENLPQGFQGSAVMSAGEPIIGTLVQFGVNVPTRNRPLSNGFSSGQGSNTFLIATVLKNQFNQTTKFSVQNTDSSPVNAEVKFFRVGEGTPAHTEQISNLPVGAARFFDAGTITQLGNQFNGSVVIEATGNVIASALELGIGGAQATYAAAFEGVAQGANTVYMPKALCDTFGGQRTAYAIQNTSTTTNASVTVTYSNGGTQAATITPGGKASFQTCEATGANMVGINGSARITSTGAEIIGIGKAFGTGLTTAFVGETQGASRLALPYVRWATDANYNAGDASRGQRTFIAVQNLGGDLAAGAVRVRYVGPDGQTLGTHDLPAIAQNAKVNSTPANANLAEFGYAAGTFGGGAIVEGPAGSQLVVVATVAQRDAGANLTLGEDYNGIPIQ